MYNDRVNTIRYVILVFVFVVVLIIAWAIFTAITQSGTKSISVVIAPVDATLVVDGRRVDSGSLRLTYGSHEYVISRGDFRSEAGTIDVTNDKNEQSITAALTPINDAGKKYAATIPDQYSAVSTSAGGETSSRGEMFADKNPIVKHLPYTNPLFSIGYRIDPDNPSGDSIIVSIDAPDVYRNNAVTQIQNWGLNPAMYDIEFVGEENPFL